MPVFLCHADDHSCYYLWTVYGVRPERYTTADGVLMERWTYEGGPCPDAPHDCIELGCGHTESWPVWGGITRD